MGSILTGSALSKAHKWISLLSRLLLGGSLLYAGANKVTHLANSVQSVNAFQLPIPYELVKVIGYGLPILEIIVGFFLILGILISAMATIGTGMMLVFIAGIVSVWARGISIDCGCFGNGGVTDDPKYLQDIMRDLLLALAGVWLMVRPNRFMSIDRWILGSDSTCAILDEEAEEVSSESSQKKFWKELK